ncbi:MAG: hypothetical protein EOM76_13220, partial [Sphingobacteriia bacterium]|nr:hypothetical protein [Sphingobacteriia bacterium]
MKLLWSVDIIAMIMVFISIFITNNYEEKEEIVIDNISMCMTIKPGIEDEITIPEERHVMVQEAFDIKEIIKATPVVCKPTIVYKPPVVKEKPK